jgi:ketosteroid isomerase-like protein
MSFAQLWTIRDGRAVALRDYATKDEALEAAGLSE